MAQEIIVDIAINQAVLDRVYDDLKIKSRPKIVVSFNAKAESAGAKLRSTEAHKKKVREMGADLMGRYKPADNVIEIGNQTRSFAYQSEALIGASVRWTLLHEIRHRWQDEQWTPEQKRRNHEGRYEERVEELDANDFAARHAVDYPGLVKVTTNRRKVRLP